jgi:hypothetical protein
MEFVTFKYYVEVGSIEYVHKICLRKEDILEVRGRAWTSVYVKGYDTSFRLAGMFAFYRLQRQLRK